MLKVNELNTIKQDPAPAGHLVLDIETLGITKGAAILSIGAVCGEASFYAVISPFEGHVEDGTLKWWRSGSVDEVALLEAFKPSKPYSLENALRDFLAFIEINKPKYFWGNSPDFDYGHLEHWLNFYGLDIPWNYYQLRDIRTIKDYVSSEELDKIEAKDYQKHVALDDAKAERDILAFFLFGNEVRNE